MATIGRATQADVPALAASLAAAFEHDPIMIWLMPAGDRRERIRRHFEVYDRGFIDAGLVWVTGDLAGVALWIPPEEAELFERIDRETLPLMADHLDMARAESLWPWVYAHAPADPCWFLDHIGVDPSRQGAGAGTALIEHGLSMAHGRGEAAWLETAQPLNVGYYERRGFRVVQEGDAPGGGPHMWFMRADPA